MKSWIALVVGLLLMSSALAEGKKKVECTLAVTPRRGESSVSGGNKSLSMSSSRSSGTGSKTITRNLKWQADLRFREARPDKLELKVYYIGYGDGGSKLKQIGQETKTVALDKDGRASLELTSPTTRLTKTRSRTTNSSHSGGFSSIKTTRSGERVAGCVIQMFADGELVKSYASDSRWTVAAGKVPFSISELEARSGKIGVR